MSIHMKYLKKSLNLALVLQLLSLPAWGKLEANTKDSAINSELADSSYSQVIGAIRKEKLTAADEKQIKTLNQAYISLKKQGVDDPTFGQVGQRAKDQMQAFGGTCTIVLSVLAAAIVMKSIRDTVRDANNDTRPLPDCRSGQKTSMILDRIKNQSQTAEAAQGTIK